MVASHQRPLGRVPNQMSEPAVPLVLGRITIVTTAAVKAVIIAASAVGAAGVAAVGLHKPTRERIMHKDAEGHRRFFGDKTEIVPEEEKKE